MASNNNPYVSPVGIKQSPTSPTFSQPNSAFQERFEDAHDNWSEEDSHQDTDETKKRKRPMSVSCEMCKQRKVKCDRGQPTCGWCAKNGQPCEYKERKKPGLRAGYGRELEARLDRLENILQNQQTILAQLTNTATQTNANPPPQQDANVFSHPLGVAPPDSQRHSSPSLNRRQEQPFNGQQSSNIADYRAFGNFNGYPPGAPQPQMQKQEQHMDNDLPVHDLLYSLVDLYFKHVNTWCPILHRKSTLDALFGPSSLDEADRALLHAIVATSLRFSTDPRLTPQKKNWYHSVSKQNVLLYCLENSSVRSLRALVILTLDVVGDLNGPPGWNLLSLITRSAVQLGLSVESSSQLISPKAPSIYTLRAVVLPEARNFVEDESRRRLFWMIYILDRYAMITTAFDFALDEKEIDRKLPCRDDMFARNIQADTRWFRSPTKSTEVSVKNENLGSFSYYVEIVGVLSRIHQFLKRPFDISVVEEVDKWKSEYRELDAALNQWKQTLPKEYGNMSRLFESSGGNKIVNCGWIMLHATFFTTTIRLHSSAAYPTHRSHLFKPSLSASQRCLSSVEHMSSLCAHVKSSGLLNKLGPPFAFSVWVASRLLLVHSSTVDHQLNPNIHSFLAILRELGTYWKVADRYANVLQRVLDEYSESERANSANSKSPGEHKTPSSVRILADMRKNAYDLDFLISRAPRHDPAVPNANNAPGTSATGASTGQDADNGDASGMPQTPAAGDNAIGAAAGAGVAAPNQPNTMMPLPNNGAGLNLSAIDPATVPNEYGYLLDVFDFFNMPRVVTPQVDLNNPHNNPNNLNTQDAASAGPTGPAIGAGHLTAAAQQQQQRHPSQDLQGLQQQQQGQQHPGFMGVMPGIGDSFGGWDPGSDWFMNGQVQGQGKPGEV